MKLSVVIPVYNEQDNITEISNQLRDVFIKNNIDGEIIFSDDGSSEPSALKELKFVTSNTPNAYMTAHRKNHGQHKAILSGYEIATGDYIVTMDCDLEQNPHDIPLLLKEILDNDFDVVFANFRRKHGPIKNFFSKIYGYIENQLLEFPKGIYRSPFFIINKSVKEQLIKFRATSPNISVLISMITKRIGKIECEQSSRIHGETKYTILKMFDLASCLFFDKSRVFQFFFLILFLVTFFGFSILALLNKIQIYPDFLFCILISFVLLGISLVLEYLHRINKNLVQNLGNKVEK